VVFNHTWFDIGNETGDTSVERRWEGCIQARSRGWWFMNHAEPRKAVDEFQAALDNVHVHDAGLNVPTPASDRASFH